MKTLLITSTSDYAGKTLVAMGLARKFQADGFKVSYMKTLGKYATNSAGITIDADAAFVHRVLELVDPIELISPVMLTQDLIIQAYRGETPDLKQKIVDAHAKLAEGKDIVIVGGPGDINSGHLLNISTKLLAERLDAKVVVIDKCEKELFANALLAAKETLKESIIGVVLNQLCQERMDYVNKYVVPYLNRNGLPVLGILPKDQILNSVSIGELCDKLRAHVLCCGDKLDELVESFGIGAMSVEGALKFLRRQVNNAVITGGDRADIQLAALETNAKCIILTGNMYPNDIIIARAEEQGVPLLVVQGDTLSTVQQVEDILGKLRIREEKKIARAMELIDETIDFQLLYERLGVEAKEAH